MQIMKVCVAMQIQNMLPILRANIFNVNNMSMQKVKTADYLPTGLRYISRALSMILLIGIDVSSEYSFVFL